MLKEYQLRLGLKLNRLQVIDDRAVMVVNLSDYRITNIKEIRGTEFKNRVTWSFNYDKQLLIIPFRQAQLSDRDITITYISAAQQRLEEMQLAQKLRRETIEDVIDKYRKRDIEEREMNMRKPNAQILLFDSSGIILERIRDKALQEFKELSNRSKCE